MRRTIELASISLAAAALFALAGAASAAPWSAAARVHVESTGPASGVWLAGRWDRHPNRHMRYRLPPDIFKPRCWVNRWGDIHCPYARRLRHSQRRHCTVDPWGRLVCP